MQQHKSSGWNKNQGPIKGEPANILVIGLPRSSRLVLFCNFKDGLQQPQEF